MTTKRTEKNGDINENIGIIFIYKYVYKYVSLSTPDYISWLSYVQQHVQDIYNSVTVYDV